MFAVLYIEASVCELFCKQTQFQSVCFVCLGGGVGNYSLLDMIKKDILSGERKQVSWMSCVGAWCFAVLSPGLVPGLILVFCFGQKKIKMQAMRETTTEREKAISSLLVNLTLK